MQAAVTQWVTPHRDLPDVEADALRRGRSTRERRPAAGCRRPPGRLGAVRGPARARRRAAAPRARRSPAATAGAQGLLGGGHRAASGARTRMLERAAGARVEDVGGARGARSERVDDAQDLERAAPGRRRRPDQRRLERATAAQRVARRGVPGGSVDDLVVVDHARSGSAASGRRPARSLAERPALGLVRPGRRVPELDVGDGDVARGEVGLELPEPAVELAGDAPRPRRPGRASGRACRGMPSSADAGRGERARSRARRTSDWPLAAADEDPGERARSP